MALNANLKIDQGATFEVTFNLKDDNDEALDLTGFTARSKIRKTFTTPTSVDFVATVNAVAGSVNLFLSANTTAAIHAGQYVYDCELVNGNTVSRFVQGVITISAEVTKNDP
jgi:hypothetical protein